MNPTLSLLAVAAVVFAPWGQSAQQPPKAWIEVAPGESILGVSELEDGIQVRVQLPFSASGIDGPEPHANKVEERKYDPNGSPGGEAQPLPSSSVLRGSGRNLRAHLGVTQWMRENGYRNANPIVSTDDTTAMVIEAPSHYGGEGRITVIRVASPPSKPKLRKLKVSNFVHANLATNGKMVYVQVEGYLQFWTTDDFLSSNKEPGKVMVTGAFLDTGPAVNNKDTGRAEYFFLMSPLTLELYFAAVHPSEGRSVNNGVEPAGQAGLLDALDVTPTSNYATYAELSPDANVLIVADRRRVSVKRRQSDAEPLQVIGSYAHMQAEVEIRSCAYAIDEASGSNGRMTLVTGLARIVARPSLTQEGSCQVSARLFQIEPGASTQLKPAFETPWLDTEHWNATSPGLLLSKDQKLLFVHTRDKVWRFEVGS